jgi:hypothetical protein
MVKLLSFCALCLAALLAATIPPAPAAELGIRARQAYVPAVYEPAEPFCPWCIRDAIYTNTKRIAHLEANPDVDDADKAPWILGGRAEVHDLRRILGPVHTVYVGPCCYWRRRLYVR